MHQFSNYRQRSTEIVYEMIVKEGLILGGSSGINIMGAIKLAKKLGKNKNIVTILCDYGTKYESKIFNKKFLKDKNLPIPSWLKKLKSHIISSPELKKKLKSKFLKIIDCRYYINDPNKGFEEYKKNHIPGALFFDLEKHSNKSLNTPHMLPTKSQFFKICS